MTGTTKKIGIIAVVGLLSLGSFLALRAQSATAAPQLVQRYKNSEHGFSLMMPADYSASIVPASDDVGAMVILQDARASGVQIIISPWDENAEALTPERIARDTSLTVMNVQPIEIPDGAGHAFQSDNDAFDGATSDIWFVHEGILYQLTTYVRLEPLLHAMFATWRFL